MNVYNQIYKETKYHTMSHSFPWIPFLNAQYPEVKDTST